ncbi:MAG: recombinase family protein [Allorhizobium sp.]
MFVRAYLRASTREQDANRARGQLQALAEKLNLKIASYYVENESGASLQRPELFRLLDDCREGDVLLIEQVDRLSRLNADDWRKLKDMIAAKRIKIIADDLPTSHLAVTADDFTGRMYEALNSMMLDMLAAIARKDYDDRRRRQAQGIEKAKAGGRYKGRPANEKQHQLIAKLLASDVSWSEIQEAVGCSRGTIANVKKKIAALAT